MCATIKKVYPLVWERFCKKIYSEAHCFWIWCLMEDCGVTSSTGSTPGLWRILDTEWKLYVFFLEHLLLLSCRNGHQNWLLFRHRRFHSLNITTITDPWWWIYPAIPISCEALSGGRGCSLGESHVTVKVIAERVGGWVRGVSKEHPEDAGHVREGGQHCHRQQLLQLLL